jgi:hypothetical protein
MGWGVGNRYRYDLIKTAMRVVFTSQSNTLIYHSDFNPVSP